jgi:hypothetical protein
LDTRFSLSFAHGIPFGGRLLVRQRAAAEFTLYRAMTLAMRSAAPMMGTIDLCGPPW